jgi:hypothetical protein
VFGLPNRKWQGQVHAVSHRHAAGKSYKRALRDEYVEAWA